eukprot:SAG25_NODE_1679_length_2565_cov_9.076237_3_plen_108_part_00
MAGDASMHLGWTFHTAAGNSAATPRCALAISFFVDGADRVLVCKAKHSCGQINNVWYKRIERESTMAGAKFYSDVLHLGAVSDTIRGIEFAMQDGACQRFHRNIFIC